MSRTIVILVLGDVGRSPRMQYHALSLLQNNYNVHIIGYSGSPLVVKLASWEGNSREGESILTVHRFATKKYASKPTIIRLPVKLVELMVKITLALVRAPTFHAVLIQNPPIIPSLFLSFVVSRFLRLTPSIIIDWHNLQFSMFPAPTSILKKTIRAIAWLYEHFFGQLGDGHFYVTDRMKKFVVSNFFHASKRTIDCGAVLHDCPPSYMFQSLKTTRAVSAARRDLFSRLNNETFAVNARKKWDLDRPLFSTTDDKTILVVSSTSWTPDEDFGILLEAMVEVQKELTKASDDKTRFLLLVTGKGPEKAMYERKIASLELPNISIGTVWLETEDYPKLLSCADLGVCLHTSTSGIDLPMKVVDMFGSGIPVFAYDYVCIGELVKDGINGRLFKTPLDLAALFAEVIDRGVIKELRDGVEGRKKSWEENWNEFALPEIQRCLLKEEERQLWLLSASYCLVVGCSVVLLVFVFFVYGKNFTDRINV